MSVKNEHADYKAMKDKWDRCQIVADGQDAVYAEGTRFLPKLSDQDTIAYDAYMRRALFFNATWRTIVGLQGMLFRKPPEVVVADSVKPLLDDVSMTGEPLYLFAYELAEECLTTGRAGVFVDYPKVDTARATAADAKRENLRPLMRMYGAMSIINWKTKTFQNRTVLSLVVLKEIVPVPKDEFTDEDQVQYRVLDLVTGVNAGGVEVGYYRVRTMIVKMENGQEVDITLTEDVPIINGKPIDYIPFQFIGVDSTCWDVDEPPLIDVVNANLAHYRVTADYEHGCHFTGLPTPVISGYTPDGSTDKFYIGSMTAWVFPNAQAKASFLEFTGAGLDCLKENLERKEQMMAILGARMLEAQAKGVESANTAAIHLGGEQSMLASMGKAISLGITKALETFSLFAGAATDTLKFELNKDFFPIPMDALTLTAIIAAWQNGAISYDSMFNNLQKGEFVAEDADPEEEQRKIKANPPPIYGVPTTPGNRAHNGPNQGAAAGTNSKHGATSSNPTQTQLQNS